MYSRNLPEEDTPCPADPPPLHEWEKQVEFAVNASDEAGLRSLWQCAQLRVSAYPTGGDQRWLPYIEKLKDAFLQLGITP